jgi:hypothetical protein
MGLPAIIARKAVSVTCRYMGANKRHFAAKRANCAFTTDFSAPVMFKSELPPGSLDTVGYT